MITIEQLQASGLKYSLRQWWDEAEAEVKTGGEHAENARGAMSVRRHPDTIVSGVLTMEQADDLIRKYWAGELPQHAMIGDGLTIINFRKKAFFLTDDSTFGYKVLPDGWGACTFRLPLGTMRHTFKTVKEFCDHYCKGERYLSTIEELVEYVNVGVWRDTPAAIDSPV